MPLIALPDVDLHVDVHGPRDGARPSVLFLHGLGSSATDWARQVPVVRERYRVLTADLRGHGRSRARRRYASVEGLADDVGRALAALGEPRVHVVGLSLGGCVGLALAAREPARVSSLTLVNAFARHRPAGIGATGRLLRRLGLLAVAPMPRVAAHVARGLFPDPGQHEAYAAAVASLARNCRWTYVATMAALARFDARRGLATVRCPTLVVVGDRDGTVPRAAADLLLGGIPRARLAIITDSGHATPYDQPGRFNTTLLEFLAQSDGGFNGDR